jgi:hypothetical protein
MLADLTTLQPWNRPAGRFHCSVLRNSLNAGEDRG